MYIYLILFFVLSVGSFIDIFPKTRQVHYALTILVFVLLFFIAGFKYETGVDWYAYKDWFAYIDSFDKVLNPSSIIFGSFDFGYNLFISVIKLFSGSMQSVYCILAMFTFFLLFRSFEKYTRYMLASLLIYYSYIFFILDMSGVRQCVALSLFLFSIQYLVQKNFLRYFTFVSLAGLFHWSAFLLLPFYFLGNKKISPFLTGVLYITGLLFFVLQIRWLENFLIGIFPFLDNELVSSKVILYTTNSALAVTRDLSPFTILNILLATMVLMISTFNKKELNKQSVYFNCFYNMYFFQLLILFFLFEFIDMSERLRLYFMIANCIIIPYLITISRHSVMKVASWFFIIFYSLIGARAYIFEAKFTVAYYPYQNFIFTKYFFQEKSTGYQRLSEHEKMNN